MGLSSGVWVEEGGGGCWVEEEEGWDGGGGGWGGRREGIEEVEEDCGKEAVSSRVVMRWQEEVYRPVAVSR